MSYHVQMTYRELVIPARNVEAVAEALAKMNGTEVFKHVDHYSNQSAPAKPADSTSLGKPGHVFRDARWNYDEILRGDAQAMLRELGYDFHREDNGDLSLDTVLFEKFDSVEELVFTTIAPYVNEGGIVKYVGENDETFIYFFDDGEVETIEYAATY